MVRGGDEAWPPERVIIGDDSSAVAKQAGSWRPGSGLFGARGVIVHAYFEMPEIDAQGMPALDPRAAGRRFTAGTKGSQRRAHELERVLGSHPRPKIAVGDAAYVLLEEWHAKATKPVLIAVGSRGLGSFGRMRLGKQYLHQGPESCKGTRARLPAWQIGGLKKLIAMNGKQRRG